MASEMEARLRALEDRVGAMEAQLVAKSSPQVPASTTSPREFLLAKAPSSDNDKTLTAGYYLEVVSGKEWFNFDDIELFYSQAKEAAPANCRDPPYQNVKKGYFREVGKRERGKTARNRWALTNSGISRVEAGFMDGGSP